MLVIKGTRTILHLIKFVIMNTYRAGPMLRPLLSAVDPVKVQSNMESMQISRWHTVCYVTWMRHNELKENERIGCTNISRMKVTYQFLGAFAKLQQTTICFVMLVRLSVCPSALFDICIFRKSVEKIQVSLKSDNDNWYVARKRI